VDAPFKPSPTVIWSCVAGAIGLLIVIWLLIKISLWRGFQRSADACVMTPHHLLLAEYCRWFLLLVVVAIAVVPVVVVLLVVMVLAR
jgi:hypothetical protein